MFDQNFLLVLGKVHIFWEGYKILRNLLRRFDWHYIGQIYDGDFAKFCGLLRIYELWHEVQTYKVTMLSDIYVPLKACPKNKQIKTEHILYDFKNKLRLHNCFHSNMFSSAYLICPSKSKWSTQFSTSWPIHTRSISWSLILTIL